MPVHDWTRVEEGIFHDFHSAWCIELRKALNGGLLPEGYYALAEQHAGRAIPDLLTLHASPGDQESQLVAEFSPRGGGTAVVMGAPQVRRRQTIEPLGIARRRSLAIRHVSGHRLVALLEILSPANKDRYSCAQAFAAKAVDALDAGIHVLIIDLFPPGKFDPQGMHGVIVNCLEDTEEPYDLPAAEPLTLASYAAGPKVEVYLEHLAVGADLPQMPLFLRPEHYINVPLETTYMEAYSGVPAFWRAVVEGQKQLPE